MSTAASRYFSPAQLESLSTGWELWEEAATTSAQQRIRGRLHLVFLLLRYGGLRLGEVLALSPRQIDVATGLIHIASSPERTILLPVTATRHMRRILSAFPDSVDDILVMDQGFIRKKLYAVASELGFDASLSGPRSLRMARGLELLTQHVPLLLVQNFLGLSSPAQREAFLRFAQGAAHAILQQQHSPAEGDTLSARGNLVVGAIQRIAAGMRMVEVELACAPDWTLTALCAPHDVVRLELHEQQVVTARILPEQVFLLTASDPPPLTSAVNMLRGTVQCVHRELAEMFVTLQLAGDHPFYVTVAATAARRFPLHEGQEVYACFTAHAVELLGS